MPSASKTSLEQVQRLLRIMVELRDKKSGCPWDVKQTMESLTRYTIEEAYEVADAIAQGDMADIKDELGDLLFQVVFYAQIAAEKGDFTFDDVAQSISDKLVRRHPHVFAKQGTGEKDGKGEAISLSSLQSALQSALHSSSNSSPNNTLPNNPPLNDSELNAQWEAIKAEEKRIKQQASETTSHTSILDSVPKGMPALMYAQKLQKACAKVGFDWPDAAPVIDKVREEVEEIQQELDAKAQNKYLNNQQAIEEEIGDALFAMVNLARHCKVDADSALRNASHKFAARFKGVEALAKQQQAQLDDLSLDEMEALWQKVKQSSNA